ncbi:hypothetical protein PHMEG_00023161 [Phytophthora megakarya]|uniref:Uncharacterized protein n=1 Tax=Phytophthora megakarya TaxID=4795 RepID=A0A225VHQ2_9STRA|nr:hypothetical protein PHMEG_00023161 [Phytophthora megakarya]
MPSNADSTLPQSSSPAHTLATDAPVMDTPVSSRGETAQDLGGNLGKTAQDSDAPVKRLQVVDLLHGSTSGSDRPSISAADDFNARNAAQNLLSTWLAKSTFLTELDAADAKARSYSFTGRPNSSRTVLLRAGYGGLENLVEVEHLSDQDRDDLSKLLSEDQDIQRELLVPRDASVEPSRHARRDFVLLEKAFNQQVAEILEQAQSRLSESDRDFQRATKPQKSTAPKNGYFEMRTPTYNVGRVMNFLNRHNARVSGNWPRLKALLEKFNSLPPDAWKTQIQINAADEFDADPGAYEYEVESDDEESKVPDVSKPQVALKMSTVDLTGPSSTESTPAKIQRKLFSGSKPKALTDFQLRLSVYAPSMTDTLDPTTAKQLFVTKAREGLTQPVIWDKLRADIQELMRSHMSYDEALAAARADAEIHSHLDARHLISMLVRIIYWKSLDRSPWAKYVPSWCYKEAESKLAKVLTSALFDSGTQEEDDEGRDATFSPGDDSQSKHQRRNTPPRQAKRGRDTTSDSSSKTKPKRASSPPKKRAKSGNGKKSLPGQGILSWRHLGILMKFLGTANAVTQSFGFPYYAPNLAEDEDVQALREHRSKFLILHVRDNLKVIARESLDAIVAFMSVHHRAIWWFGHWVFIDLETDDPYSVEFHRERKAECDKAKKEYKKLLDDRVDAGLEETILDEPGSWTIPAKCCHWILMHESQVKDDGTRYTLKEQMELLDDQEPARVQWNTCASDEVRIKHIPENYPLKLLKEH